jgi:hypothetical protein
VTRPRPLELNREAVDILLAHYDQMGLVRRNRTEYEDAVVVLYELILFHETVKMGPEDAAVVEAAATLRPRPERPQRPARPNPPDPPTVVEPPPEATQLPA